MIKYDSYIYLLLLFPDFTLRHAMNAMFIVYTKAQIAKQSTHFGEKEIGNLFFVQIIIFLRQIFSPLLKS